MRRLALLLLLPALAGCSSFKESGAGIAGGVGGALVAQKAELLKPEFLGGALIAYAIDNVSTIRASVGSRMVELDAQVDLSAEHDLEYSDTLSRLQDLDYNEAISRFSQQQTVLQAAQQSYVRVTGLSLFDLLR